jgi:PAS domain S-box-containing protein
MTAKKAETDQFNFLNGGGACGELIRLVDWSNTPVGDVELWPQSLKTTLSIVLNSRFPMFLFWGPELVCFYNDAYRPSLGNNGKHPSAMGQKAQECWPEIWDSIKPIIDEVLTEGKACWYEDRLLPIYRNGALEEVYWTFSYSSVCDESGSPAGVFVTCTETTEKIRTVEALNQSKDELEFAINAAELATWDLNPHTGKFSGNHRLKEWFGLNNEEDIDLSVATTAIIEKDRQRVNDAIQNAMKFSSGGMYNVQYTLMNSKTGQQRIVLAKGKALFDESNVATRFNGTLEDITQETISRNALEESERNFRSLVQQAPVGMMILTGAELMVELVNDSYMRLVGKKKRDFVNKPLWEGLPEVKSQGFDELLKEVMRTGIAYYGSEQAVHLLRNGEKDVVYVNFVYEPLKEANGLINKILVIANDVTEQVLSRQAIEIAEERARLAADAVSLGTFDLNLQTNEMGTSDRFNRIFGFNAHMPRAQYARVIHPDDREIRLAAHRKALQTGRIFYEVRIIPHNKPSVRWVRVEGKVYFGDYDKPIRMLGTVQDITQIRQTEEDLLKINQQLQVALEEQKGIQKQKDDFLGIASHELKTPVTSIKAYAQVLQKVLKTKGDERESIMMAKMDAQINRLTSLIGDLLDVTKMNTGRMEFHYSDFDLNEMIKAIVEELQRTTERHTIETELQDVGTIHADKERLGQVLINLLSNAIKYSPDANKIRVYSYLENKEIIVCVEDYGIGISEDNLQKVFEQFYRVSGNMQHTFPGLGLGLYISSEIIRREGGRLWVNSVQNAGSTFCFSLPVSS